MAPLLLTAALAVAAIPVETYESYSAGATALAEQVDTGTLLLTRGDCLAIRVATRSAYTHVAAVVLENGQPFVYDSMNGSGVRRSTLVNYLATHQPETIDVVRPTQPFSPVRAGQFRLALAEQLGRPYAIVHHVTGRRSSGLHCSEYVTDALVACEVLNARRPARVTPGSLADGLIAGGVYEQTRTIRFATPEPSATGDNWCEELWFDTTRCTRTTWKNLCDWFCCK
jgi:hypothetical protein